MEYSGAKGVNLMHNKGRSTRTHLRAVPVSGDIKLSVMRYFVFSNLVPGIDPLC